MNVSHATAGGRRPPALLLAAMLLAGVQLKPAPANGAEESGVVAIGGAVTEIVYALGAGDRLVAVDSTSRHPRAARKLPDVGYMRQLSAEPILALDPDRVLAVADAGPPHVMDQLRQAGVGVTTVPDEPSPDGVIAKVRHVARALDREARGRKLAARLRSAFDRVAARTARLDETPSVLFLLSAGQGPPLVAGRETSAARIIALAGGRNAVDGFTGFKPLSPEAAVAARPEVILTTEQTRETLGGKAALLDRPALAETPAGEANRLIAMDGLLLLGFGPRTPQAARRLAKALHPGAWPPAGTE